MELVDLDTFAREPFGRATAGERWLRFYVSPQLAGFVAWGALAEGDVAALVHVLDLHFDSQPHVTLADVRRVKGGDDRAFALLQGFARRQREHLGRVVTRIAIVRPEGFLGATAAGFYGIEAPPCPVEIFDDRARALAWLGEGGPALDAELDRLVAISTGTAPFLRELQTLLEAQPTLSGVADVARAMAVSTRTLQRRLRELDTTLSREIASARVRAAKVRLRNGDLKLAQIALEVGCATPSHLSALFRKVTGLTPLEWRRRRDETSR